MGTAYNRSRQSHALLYTLIAIVAIFSGYLAAQLVHPSATQPITSGSLVPAPSTLEDLIKDTDAIVIGTVGQLIHHDTFAGYDETGVVKKAQELNLPPDAEVPLFDYELRVEKILKPHGSMALNQPIILRMLMDGDPSKDYFLWEYPPSFPGEHRLFFLSINPDGTTYGLKYGPASRIVIDGAIATRSDGKRTPVTGTTPVRPIDFIRRVEQIVHAQAGK